MLFLIVGFRMIGLFVTIIGLILFVISLITFTFCFLFVLLTCFMHKGIRMLFYVSIMVVLFCWAIFRFGIVMFLISAPCAILGFIEYVLRMICANVYMGKVLLYFDSTQDAFILKHFIEKIVNYIVDLLIFIVNDIDGKGDVKRQLEDIRSKQE